MHTSKVTRTWLLWSVLLTSAFVAFPTVTFGQEDAGSPAAPSASAEATEQAEAAEPSDAPEEPATSTAEASDADAAPADDATPADDAAAPAGTASTPDADEPETAEEVTADPTSDAVDDAEVGDVPDETTALPAGATEPSLAEQAARDAGVAETIEEGWSPWLTLIVILALFIVPIVIGNYLAKVWRMPDHGWKFSLILGTLAAALLICTFGEFKFGPDLAGGITLIYELADAQPVQDAEAAPPGQEQVRAGGREFEIRKLIGALKQRLDPDGTKEITIREYGSAIEIIIPETGQDEMEYVKRRITDMGQLEFRITADAAIPKDRSIIERARALPPSQKVLMDGKNKLAEWVAYDVEEFGPAGEDHRLVTRMAGDTPEALVLIDPMNVTGEYLTQAMAGLDNRGGDAVHFAFDSQGARLFRQLTSQNKPNPATPNVYRNLGIILDKTLISAPRIETTISDRGMISGGSMTEREVKHIVEILDAGSLPAALAKTPISEEIISPTLGADTVEKGARSIIAALVAVLVFMLIYYRFAGIVACLALSFNLLLVLALMVLIKAAFTLPGLAGLVLTIGMSVDANILIYERIREELQNGSAMRMAIRNGFSRALSAIIDSNVTTIIAGIALFYIGTDQVKGFAVTMILGILTSMFTAIFFARVVFDVAERRGWIPPLKMMRILSRPNVDFLSVRWITSAVSLVLIVVGMVAAVMRGPQMFDIDFTGGSSVTFTLNEAGSMPITQVQNLLDETSLSDKNLLVVRRGETNRRYTVDSSEESVAEVKEIIQGVFGDRLMKYSLDVRDVKPFSEGEIRGTQATLLINQGSDFSEDDGMSHAALNESLRGVLEAEGFPNTVPQLENPNYRRGSSARFKEWTVRLPGLDVEAAQSVFDRMQSQLTATPLFPLANSIGGRVSADMQTKALLAIGVSLVGVIGYLWLRFQRVTYGLAAGIALVHDVLVTIGCMAISAYVVQAVPALAHALQLEAFQISLTIVAALLTIIGYSLNDTIVTFDRLREIKGKSPKLTPEMVNASVNQCLSRTILTAVTSFLVVVILYFFGGEGIHSFAFAFLIGIVAGTYSTVFIAAPALLWLSGAPTGISHKPVEETAPRTLEAVR